MLSFIPLPYRILAVAVILLAAFGAGGWTMHRWHENAAKASLLDSALATIGVERKQAAITAASSESAAVAKERIRVVTRTIVKEVTAHVSAQADAACTVPVGFVRVHDSAASGVPIFPGAAGEPDDRPAGIAISAVSGTVAENYGTCREIRADLMALQAWVRAQQAPQ